jgi:hypothetical protein
MRDQCRQLAEEAYDKVVRSRREEAIAAIMIAMYAFAEDRIRITGEEILKGIDDKIVRS